MALDASGVGRDEEEKEAEVEEKEWRRSCTFVKT
jgi:hypothetical protein